MQRTGRVVHAHPHSRPPTPRPPAPSPARPACTLACTHPRPHTLVRTHERRCGHSCGRSRSLTVPPSSARVPVRSRSSPPARVRAVRARPRSRPPARVCAALICACPCLRPLSFASTRTHSCCPHPRMSLSAPALVRVHPHTFVPPSSARVHPHAFVPARSRARLVWWGQPSFAPVHTRCTCCCITQLAFSK